MKNKKGFTLIELLAVIVILAIIALIVTPVVSNIVANARIAANARSVEGHIRNIELAIITKAFGENSTGDLDSFDTITSGVTIESSPSRAGNDNVTCETYIISHGTVITADKCKDIDNKWGKKYTYSNSEGAVVYESFKGTIVAKQAGETHKGIVYMDPSNPKAVCNSSSTITTTPDGCKKFYIYDDSGDTYKMINDRNLGSGIQWNPSGKNASMSTAFTTAIADRTAGWDAAGSVRLISADEIAHIVGADSNDTIKWSSSLPYGTTVGTQSSWFYLDGGRNSAPTTYSDYNGWQKQYAYSTRKSNYAWLYDYTGSCTTYGCQSADSSTYSYWTSSAVWGSTDTVWYVRNYGGLNSYYANNNSGIRPVLEIPKSIIEG